MDRPASSSLPDNTHLQERALAEARNGIVITDPHQTDNPIVYFNRAFQELTGFAEGEILGRNCRFLQGADTDSATVGAIHQALQQESDCQVTLLNYRKDGTSFWNELTISPVRDEQGRLTHFIGVQTDVTAHRAMEEERQRTETALRESEARFRLMADAMPHIAWTTEADGAVNYYNQRWYDYSGLTFAQTRDWGWEAVIHPEDLDRAGGVWRTAILAGIVSEVEYRLRRADGAYRWHLGRSEPVQDETGRVIMWVGTATDITARKEAELAQIALAMREHTIATQLQEALQPSIPRAMPGLALAKYYEAALPESGVGGDFLDCFILKEGCTALVVGDVSGKGLAAAVQVATVRNMLRFAVYNGRTLAGPVTRLNHTLAENELLTGFCTLFIGCYDAAERTLTYVNAGQEPGLVRRAATGKVEELLPTGPILGTIEGAAFDERIVHLLPGDALAIFTDGLTEAGPTHREMLGLAGVASLLGDGAAGEDARSAGGTAEALALLLIAGVDRFAGQGTRDDICLLVGVAT